MHVSAGSIKRQESTHQFAEDMEITINFDSTSYVGKESSVLSCNCKTKQASRLLAKKKKFQINNKS